MTKMKTAQNTDAVMLLISQGLTGGERCGASVKVIAYTHTCTTKVYFYDETLFSYFMFTIKHA